ncbi:MAG: Coenzyme F420 hydrogenase/dehydrogenase, beta subunit C-terminal domain, partial [Planctomycetes bacterium]|nr:Coenzyme F420 hydrogenase/dehydrogenase, beta subunit C-terminal domain [Planctomycetota bacterium]
ASLAVTGRDVLAARGSRYTPASACLGLAGVLERPGRYAFVGKPCEVSALRMLQAVVPVLGERIVLAVGLFCAQTPARSLTEAFLASVGVAKDDVEAVEYRGRGWPGTFTVLGGGRILYECDYTRVWNFLVDAVPQVRCFLCEDAVAGSADISVGDPWGLPEGFAVGSGMSYVVARTEAGKRFVAEAAAKGAIALDQAPEALVTGRNEMQARRAAEAAQRRLTYSALFARSGIVKALARNGFSFLPTLLRQRLRGEYF